MSQALFPKNLDFIKKKRYEFSHIEDFLNFLNTHKLYIAIPLPTTSVLGSLFVHWVYHHFYNTLGGKELNIRNVKDVESGQKIKNTQRKQVKSSPKVFQDRALRAENLTQNFLKSKSFKFVKSWSQAFGLFERKIVFGFLSFETSEIFYQNHKEVIKVKFHSGHPLMKEYFAFSKNHSLKDKEIQGVLKVIYSPQVQRLVQEKNYMKPVIKGVFKSEDSENKLDPIDLYPTMKSEKLRQLWSQK